MKNLDKKVLLILVGGTLFRMILTLFCSSRGHVPSFLLYLPYVFGIIIFLMFLKDKDYTWKYYIFYVLSVSFIRVAIESVMPLVIMSLRYSDFMVLKVFFIGHSLQLLLAFVSALLYGTFKHMSYKNKYFKEK